MSACPGTFYDHDGSSCACSISNERLITITPDCELNPRSDPEWKAEKRQLLIADVTTDKGIVFPGVRVGAAKELSRWCEKAAAAAPETPKA